MILSDLKQSLEQGRAGVFIPVLQMRTLWPRGCKTGLSQLSIGGARIWVQFVEPRASAFSVLFHKNSAQQSYSLKAIMVVFRFHAVKTLCKAWLLKNQNNSKQRTPVCCIHAGLTNSSRVVILLSKLPKIDKTIYLSNGKMSLQIRK